MKQARKLAYKRDQDVLERERAVRHETEEGASEEAQAS